MMERIVCWKGALLSYLLLIGRACAKYVIKCILDSWSYKYGWNSLFKFKAKPGCHLRHKYTLRKLQLTGFA